MSATTRHTTRSALTVGAIVVVLILIVALPWEALAAARAQRATVEAVLRDYAEIAAEQYADGVAMALDYGWFYPVQRAVRIVNDRIVAPGPEVEIETQTGRHRMADLVTRFFLAGAAHGAATGASGWPEPIDDAAMSMLLRRDARIAARRDWPSAVRVYEDGPDERLIVYRVSRADDDAGLRVVGFDAPLAGFEAVLRPAARPVNLLPSAFLDDSGREAVALRVLTPGGRVLFESGAEFDATYSATATLGARFGGIDVVAAVPPAAAPHLVIGGLPRSRLPLIIAMLVVAVGLLGGGILLIRQERELLALRERFVAGVSHELRTPLAQIRMFAETLHLDRVRSGGERRRAAQILDREAHRLSYLVENLLHFSTPRRRASPIDCEPIDLGNLAREVLDAFRPLAASRRAGLRLEAASEVRARIGRDEMRQVLLNLLDNASKYGPPGQTITVTIANGVDGRATLAVDDEGSGVPRADRGRIWDRFCRGDDTAHTTGTGIGLSLVKELVESNAGRVAVTSAPGGGARFRVSLPGEQ